ncbi:hypothetical protein ACF0H5_010513 [Mactra antiquata]
MVPVFTDTTCVLSTEYVSSFASEKLAMILFRIGKDAGVECRQARKSFTLAGDWLNIMKAHSILEEHFQREVVDDIQIETGNCDGSESKGSRRGRKPGCTVDKSLYKKIPQPMLHYHDDKGVTLSSKTVNSKEDEGISKHDTESSRNDFHNECLEKNNKNVLENHTSDKDILNKGDGEKSTEKQSENIAKESEAMVKTEFDDSVMDEDTDVEEQCSSSAVVGQSTSQKSCLNVQVKIEIEDSDYEKQINKSDSKSLQDKGDSVKRRASPKTRDTVKKSKGAKQQKVRKKSKALSKSPPKSKTVKPKTDKIKNVEPKTDENFKCDQCDYVGKKRDNLREHKGRMHQIKFNCETCNKQFGLHKDLLRHTRYVHTTPSFHCKICDKTYKFNRAYKEHMLSHEENYVKPQFECDLCHKNFSTKYVLTSHIKSEHLGIKKSFICPTCGRSFTQKNSYIMHANVHAGIKPYVCDVCGKAFSYDKSLKEHKYMHDEERRFECSLCDKKFRQKTSLIMHQKVHKQAKDYMCTACGKGFTQKQALLRHERIHSGDKPFKCALCLRSFNDYSIIRRHMMMHHKRDKDPKTWRGDIICTLKKKHEFYIEGGPGYNGGDRFPMAEESKDDTTNETSKPKSSSETIENNGSTLNGNNYSVPCTDSANSVIDSSGLYHVPDSCQTSETVDKHGKSDHTNSPALPLNYSLPLNFQPNVSVPSGQTATDDAARQYQEMLDYRNHSQRQDVFLSNNVPVVPHPGLSSQSHIGSIQGETTQGQTGPNPWGLPGYPPYYSPANFSHYPGQQN